MNSGFRRGDKNVNPSDFMLKTTEEREQEKAKENAQQMMAFMMRASSE